ncbi:MAG TPA: GGDEF domain-containing protein [Kiloniellales bacterium]
MRLSRIETHFGDFERDPLPQLCAATERLRRLAADPSGHFAQAEQAAIGEVLKVAVKAEQALAVQRARIRFLEGLSITDELTGLLNRRGFQAELSRALARAQRVRESGLLVLCDLDRFKAINDKHGHLAGDAVLCAVAGLLQAKTRRIDYVARLGGDEFAVLLTHSPRADAERRVKTVAALVNSLVVDWEGQKIAISASFGFEGYHQGSDPDALLFLADRSLYKHKGPRLVSPAVQPQGLHMDQDDEGDED